MVTQPLRIFAAAYRNEAAQLDTPGLPPSAQLKDGICKMTGNPMYENRSRSAEIYSMSVCDIVTLCTCYRVPIAIPLSTFPPRGYRRMLASSHDPFFESIDTDSAKDVNGSRLFFETDFYLSIHSSKSFLGKLGLSSNRPLHIKDYFTCAPPGVQYYIENPKFHRNPPIHFHLF